MINKINIALDIGLIIISIIMLIIGIPLAPTAGFCIIFKCFSFYLFEAIVGRKSIYLAIIWGIILFTAVASQKLDSWIITFCALGSTLSNNLINEISS